MARADLSAMLGRLEDDEPEIATTPVVPARTPKKGASGRVTSETPLQPRDSPVMETPTLKPTTDPLYLRLERKETRLRTDQYADLTTHARRLNRAKGTTGERITENTLIRVAIDLLLERATDLSGATEAELKNSVSTRLTELFDSQAPVER